MRKRVDDAIDIIAALLLIVLLFVPTINQQVHGSQAKTNMRAHRIVISSAHHRKGADPARP